ncbi:hypothetical protein BaRGS_00019251 [Batillaria attramentaria]|uniref:Uncharacterized protein n=1 Tax=Batillaria attramentaria TaxID=370345 RepID=A0ABD0KQE0_9CAEN
MTAQDEGWAWVVLGACLGANYLIGVLVYFIGVIHVELLDRFQDDVTTTAWAGAIYSSLQMLGAPLATWVVHTCGCRVSVVTGGVLLCAGFAASAFATSVLQLLFTYGLVAGTGMALTFVPSYMTISFYFNKKLGLASGIAVSAAAVGILSGSLITQLLFDIFGLTGAFLLIGGISLHFCVFGMLMRPTEFEGKPWKRKKRIDAGVNKSSAISEQESQVLLPCDEDKTLNENDRREDIDVTSAEPILPQNSLQAGTTVRPEQNCKRENPSDPGYIHSETDSTSMIPQPTFPLEETITEDDNNVVVKDFSVIAKDIRLGTRPETTPPDEIKSDSLKGYTEYADDENREDSLQRKPVRTKYVRVVTAMCSLARNLAFVSHCFSVFFVNVTMSGVNLHLPEYARTLGTTPTEAASLYVGVGVLSLVSRLTSGFLTTGSRVDPLYVSVCLMGLGGVSTSLFPLYSRSYPGQMVFACLYGLSTGGFYTLINVLTVDLVGLHSLAMAYGAEVFIMGVGYMAGSPLAGIIVDLGGTYDQSFTFLGEWSTVKYELSVPRLERFSTGKKKQRLSMAASCLCDVLSKVIKYRGNTPEQDPFSMEMRLEAENV